MSFFVGLCTMYIYIMSSAHFSYKRAKKNTVTRAIYSVNAPRESNAYKSVFRNVDEK